MGEQLTFSNQHVKRLRRLIGRRSARYVEGCFVLEGRTVIGEAIARGFAVDTEFVAPGGEPVTERWFDLADGVIERVSDTKSPQPNVAIIEMPNRGPVLDTARRVVVLDRIGDPGNLGTVIRSAEAAGFDAVVVTPGSVDAYSPKVVRSSAGAVLYVPVVEATLDEVGAAGLRRVGTSSHQGESYRSADWSGRVAVVMGNEAHGLDDDAAIDQLVTIPLRGRAESLNVAMAATLLIFAANG